jgi:hypothetical protein
VSQKTISSPKKKKKKPAQWLMRIANFIKKHFQKLKKLEIVMVINIYFLK